MDYSTEKKEIVKKYRKEWYEKNKQKLLQKRKEYYQKNREEINKKNGEFYQNNKEKLLKKQKDWYEKNKEEVLKKSKDYYQDNREDILERVKDYYQDNREYKIDYNKTYTKSQGAITLKLNNCKIADIEKHRDYNIDKEHIEDLLKNQDYKCNNCKIKVKMEWEDAFDPIQFSINRLDNSKGHIKGNVEITCYKCNLLLK
jgi:hypothetical protein